MQAYPYNKNNQKNQKMKTPNYKIILTLLISFFFSFSFKKSTESKKWGFYGHKRINRIAIFTLPPEMFGFYKEHIEFITDHAVDPDKRRYAVEGEAQRHYIDIDHYYVKGYDVFDLIPHQWNLAIEKYTEDTLQTYGIVPWHIQTMKFRLQKAFEEKNIDLILKYSAEIGHYIGDAHVPLHTTENYNGQLTNQKGIHGLWESRIVELNADKYNYFIGKSFYIEELNDYIWKAVQESHLALDSVFRLEKEVTNDFPSDKKYSFETKGNITSQVYSFEFCQEYNKRMNGMVERRLRKAIISVGSIWFSAWVDAGQPDLSKLQNIPPSQSLLEEIKNLNEKPHTEKHNERNCD
jgi:hypothetical protein